MSTMIELMTKVKSDCANQIENMMDSMDDMDGFMNWWDGLREDNLESLESVLELKKHVKRIGDSEDKFDFLYCVICDELSTEYED